MKVNRYGSAMTPLATEATAQPQQQQQTQGVSPLSQALAPNALSGDSYKAAGTGGYGATGAPTAGSNPLQSNPMGVLGGALMASKDLEGLKPDLEKLQAQIVTEILKVVLDQVQNLVKQLAGQLGGQLGGAAGNAGNGGNAGAAGNAGNGGNAGAAGNAGNGGNAGAAGNAGNGGNAGAAGNAGNGGNAGAAGNAGGKPGCNKPGAGGVQGGYGAGGGTQGGYGTGGGTQGGYGTPGTPGTPTGPRPPGGAIDPNLNYQSLNSEQRTQLSGMNERERAALHLWGIQMGSAGKQDGGVLLNVMNNPEQFKPAEVALAKELIAKDQAQYGGVTGKALDQEYFGLYQKLTGKDISQRYGNAPVNFAQGPVNMGNRQTGANGLNNFENEVLQLWGHSPLLSGGKIDGSILAYSMNSPNKMEVNLNQADLKGLFDADMASDGVLNGDSLENAMVDVMDRVYLGAPSANMNKTMNDALEQAAQRRDGLLPPPDRAAADLTKLQGGGMDAISQLHGKKVGGGNCPFLGKQAA